LANYLEKVAAAGARVIQPKVQPTITPPALPGSAAQEYHFAPQADPFDPVHEPQSQHSLTENHPVNPERQNADMELSARALNRTSDGVSQAKLSTPLDKHTDTKIANVTNAFATVVIPKTSAEQVSAIEEPQEPQITRAAQSSAAKKEPVFSQSAEVSKSAIRVHVPSEPLISPRWHPVVVPPLSLPVAGSIPQVPRITAGVPKILTASSSAQVSTSTAHGNREEKQGVGTHAFSSQLHADYLTAGRDKRPPAYAPVRTTANESGIWPAAQASMLPTPRNSRDNASRITIGRVDVQVNNHPPISTPPAVAKAGVPASIADVLETRYLNRFPLKP